MVNFKKGNIIFYFIGTLRLKKNFIYFLPLLHFRGEAFGSRDTRSRILWLVRVVYLGEETQCRKCQFLVCLFVCFVSFFSRPFFLFLCSISLFLQWCILGDRRPSVFCVLFVCFCMTFFFGRGGGGLGYSR